MRENVRDIINSDAQVQTFKAPVGGQLNASNYQRCFIVGNYKDDTWFMTGDLRGCAVLICRDDSQNKFVAIHCHPGTDNILPYLQQKLKEEGMDISKVDYLIVSTVGTQPNLMTTLENIASNNREKEPVHIQVENNVTIDNHSRVYFNPSNEDVVVAQQSNGDVLYHESTFYSESAARSEQYNPNQWRQNQWKSRSSLVDNRPSIAPPTSYPSDTFRQEGPTQAEQLNELLDKLEDYIDEFSSVGMTLGSVLGGEGKMPQGIEDFKRALESRHRGADRDRPGTYIEAICRHATMQLDKKSEQAKPRRRDPKLHQLYKDLQEIGKHFKNNALSNKELASQVIKGLDEIVSPPKPGFSIKSHR